jgi:hypothetical protein
MVNLNQNDNNNFNENFTQFTTNLKNNQINFYKNSAKNNNLSFIDSDSNQGLRIYHQNICGLGSKTNDLLISLYQNLPHILCLTEHHLRQFQIQHITIDDYILGAEFSRRSFHKGGVCMFIQKHFPYSVINIEKFCKDKELEACALKSDFLPFKVCIITVYRSPNCILIRGILVVYQITVYRVVIDSHKHN